MNGSRAWLEKDFYKVLGVAENAPADEIKRAYKKLARQHHPDRNPGDRKAEERMKEISEANDVLGDPQKRAEYDEMRRMARGGFGSGGFGGGFSGVNVGDLGDLGDLFGGVFGGARRRGRRAARGADLETSVHISFEQAAQGATVPVQVRRDAPCRTCAGSGDASGSAQACSTCRGTGMVQESQGLFSFARPCVTCAGAGRVVVTPCGACAGSGVETRSEELKVKIPAGVKDGARIRVRERGGAVAGGQTGDLYVVVSVAPHPVFGRSDADLTLDLTLTYPQLALGATVSVPTLDEPVRLKIPAGTQPGRTFRVRGRGLPKRGGTGDLLVTVNVTVPSKLGAEERELIERLAALDGAREAEVKT